VSSGVTDMKRWLAALCVALIAFVMIEQASPAHAAAMTAEASVSYNIAEAVAAGDAQNGDHHPAAPVEAQHHCCCAHTGGLPVLDARAAHPPRAAALQRPTESQMAPNMAPLGLDRPPKPNAIV
jgi:hypothetical protein